MPLPRPEITPPETKMYLVFLSGIDNYLRKNLFRQEAGKCYDGLWQKKS